MNIGGQLQPHLAVFRKVSGKVLCLKPLDQAKRYLGLIFNDQNAHIPPVEISEQTPEPLPEKAHEPGYFDFLWSSHVREGAQNSLQRFAISDAKLRPVLPLPKGHASGSEAGSMAYC